MIEAKLAYFPADDFPTLTEQLKSALRRLTEDDGSDADPAGVCRSYVQYAVALAWRGVARGEPKAAGDALECLGAFRGFVRRHLPAEMTDQQAIACDLLGAIKSLDSGDRALEQWIAEHRLLDRERSATERMVLSVLLASERALRRGEVRDLLPPEHRRTPARIGQILAQLHQDRFVTRLPRPARGGSSVGFYELSERGEQLCKRLELEYAGPRLFDYSQELQRRCLQPGRVEQKPAGGEPGRIATFWAYSGGMGRTAAIAHAGWSLAGQLPVGERVLVADFDLAAPSLESLFSSAMPADCRGLRGLILDYHHQPVARRKMWLRQNLDEGDYLFRPYPEDCPNLFVLPSGFAATHSQDVESERSRAESMLAAEVGVDSTRLGRQKRGLRARFLLDLAESMTGRFRKTLIDSAAGLSLGAWVSIQLADEFLLFGTSNPAAVRGARVAVANFIDRQERFGRHRPARLAFVYFQGRSASAHSPEALKDLLENVVQPASAVSNLYFTLDFDAHLGESFDNPSRGGSKILGGTQKLLNGFLGSQGFRDSPSGAGVGAQRGPDLLIGIIETTEERDPLRALTKGVFQSQPAIGEEVLEVYFRSGGGETLVSKANRVRDLAAGVESGKSVIAKRCVSVYS